ncbi:MAG: hypothetical protein M1480_06910 [Bacteroidetes bacterium]|nr:hypothetical protein [Bacteroidota bacterium]
MVNEKKKAGNYSTQFAIGSLPRRQTGTQSASGVFSKGGYASGVYFYQSRADNFVSTKKLIQMK